MNTRRVLERSWEIVWHYRALWILGMILAWTAGNTIYLGPHHDRQPQPQNIKIKLTDTATITLPGEGLTIDLTAPGGARVLLTDGPIEREDRLLTDLVRQTDFIAIGIEILVLVVLISLITTVARYVAETAVIRMVNDTEATGKALTFRQGLRLGWSIRAVRLWLIDLLVGLAAAAVLAVVLSMSVGSILLATLLGAAAIVLAVFGVLGLLSTTGILLLGMRAAVSLAMQPVRRACVIDGMGVFASIGAGIAMLRRHLMDVGITWIIWIGIRILWAPLSIVAAIILFPILPVSLLAGVLAGLVSAALAVGIASPFVHGLTPWIIGAIAGLPIFILVVILPLLFVGGFVEIYKSSLWTLAYRELSGMERTAEAPQPNRPLTATPGIAD